jgi:WD40 repeat protein
MGGPFAVAPGELEALVSVGDALCGSIAWADSTAVHPWELVISSDRQAWSLADYFAHDDPPCSSDGRARWPAWSPDGGTVALFGSPDSIGVAGQGRLEVPWTLYLVAPGESEATPLLDGVRHAQGLTWSPDSQRLALSGELAGEAGIWVVEARTGTVTRVSQDPASWLSWSPDGKEIAALIPVDEPGSALESVVRLLDVSVR